MIDDELSAAAAVDDDDGKGLVHRSEVSGMNQEPIGPIRNWHR